MIDAKGYCLLYGGKKAVRFIWFGTLKLYSIKETCLKKEEGVYQYAPSLWKIFAIPTSETNSLILLPRAAFGSYCQRQCATDKLLLLSLRY